MKIITTVTIVSTLLAIFIYSSRSNASFINYTCFHNNEPYATTTDADYCPAVPPNHLDHINHTKNSNPYDKDLNPYDLDCYVHVEDQVLN